MHRGNRQGEDRELPDGYIIIVGAKRFQPRFTG